VRHLIRNKATGAFFAHGKWTKDAKQAQEFPTLREVKKAKRKFKLENVELYCQVGKAMSPKYDFTLPLL
jgi:hypothetical protein